MHLLLHLLLQIAVVLLVARLVGWLFRRIGQPQVVGEMVAGIVLGPSLLGWLAPGVTAFLFPAESLGALNVLAQVGLVLFMFLIGLELDPRLLRGRGETALVTSHASIALPFILGAGLALYLYPLLSDAAVPFLSFALFMGAAMSVTAFPVLARILTERNLLRTKVGAVTIACAAVDDVTAWTLLAGVVVIARAAGADTLFFQTIPGILAYVGAMLFVVRPALRRLETFYQTRGRLTQDVLAVVLLLVLASAWTTEWLGIHALFGAFLLGAIMPKDRDFVHDLTEKLEDLTVVFLLPLFFAYTGLRTQIGLVSGAAMWLDAALILLVAIAGKFGGSTLAARATGLTWREASALGILMNTRGLMELVFLSIGLDLGVISPALFAMMVLMALVTTFMTSPLLEWIYPARLLRKDDAEGAAPEFRVLLPVSLPSSGPELLRVAQAVAPPGPARYYALHLLRAEDEALFAGTRRTGALADLDALRPLMDTATARGAHVQPMAFVSRDAGGDIVAAAHVKEVNLVLLGWHKPILSESVLGGTVGQVLAKARTDVGVYIGRHGRRWQRVLVPYAGGPQDDGALALAARLAANDPDVSVTLLHVNPTTGSGSRLRTTFPPDRLTVTLVQTDRPLDALIAASDGPYDLIVCGASEVWQMTPALFGPPHVNLGRASSASLLIVQTVAG